MKNKYKQQNRQVATLRVLSFRNTFRPATYLEALEWIRELYLIYNVKGNFSQQFTFLQYSCFAICRFSLVNYACFWGDIVWSILIHVHGKMAWNSQMLEYIILIFTPKETFLSSLNIERQTMQNSKSSIQIQYKQESCTMTFKMWCSCKAFSLWHFVTCTSLSHHLPEYH